MEKVLIFDTVLSGHHLEYLHHIYEGASRDKNRQYVFVLPDSFNTVKEKYAWTDTGNCIFDFINKKDVDRCNDRRRLISSYYLSITLRSYSLKHGAKRVFLNMLSPFLPFLLFLIPSSIKVSGIIYKVFLYEESLSRVKRFINFVLYGLLVKSRVVNNIFILNDKSSVSYFNRLFSTNKYKYLLDPICVEGKAQYIRELLNIDKSQKIFLQFGGITRRKGSLLILDSIRFLNEQERTCYVFVFAGKIYDDIRADFYSAYQQLREISNIRIFDEFCSYAFIRDLCYSSDAILVPYSNTTQSSGLIGYASYFKKPVIGPHRGLLGKIIRKNHLGLTLENLNGSSLALNYQRALLYTSSDFYAKSNTIKRFVEIIINNI